MYKASVAMRLPDYPRAKRKIMQVDLERSDVHSCHHVIVAVATSEFFFLASKNISSFL